jgi:hypothetical protein
MHAWWEQCTSMPITHTRATLFAGVADHHYSTMSPWQSVMHMENIIWTAKKTVFGQGGLHDTITSSSGWGDNGPERNNYWFRSISLITNKFSNVLFFFFKLVFEVPLLPDAVWIYSCVLAVLWANGNVRFRNLLLFFYLDGWTNMYEMLFRTHRLDVVMHEPLSQVELNWKYKNGVWILMHDVEVSPSGPTGASQLWWEHLTSLDYWFEHCNRLKEAGIDLLESALDF